MSRLCMCAEQRDTGEELPLHVEDGVRMIRESVELEVQRIDDLLDLTKIAQYVGCFFLSKQSGRHGSTISES